MTVTINGTGPGNWDSSGNLGIGTASPATTLDINVAAGSNTNVAFSQAGGVKWYVGNTTSTNAFRFYDNTAAAVRAGIDSSGNFQFNSGYGSSATAYGCRAWVNWNGTGTVAIRASGNVTSITDNGTGDYTVNFTTAMPDANYNITGTAGGGVLNTNPRLIGPGQANPTASAVRVVVVEDTGTQQDMAYCSISIFR